MAVPGCSGLYLTNPLSLVTCAVVVLRAFHEETERPPSTTLSGTVEKVVKSPDPSVPDKAQINIEHADPLYAKIRVENTLTNEKGQEVALQQGAQVDVTIEADPKDTIIKQED